MPHLDINLKNIIIVRTGKWENKRRSYMKLFQTVLITLKKKVFSTELGSFSPLSSGKNIYSV